MIFDIIESKVLGNISFIPSLASQVEFNKKGIFDISIQNQVDLNASALDIFKSINGQATIEDIVEKMNKKYKCKTNVLRKDITNILNDANKKNLINYNIKSNNILYKLIGKMYLYLFENKNRRFDITSKSFIKIFTEILKIILIKFSWVIFLNIFNMIILYLLPTTNDNFIFEILFNVFLDLNIVLFGGFSSIALHEALHAYYFRKSINYSGGFLLVNRLSVSFKRRSENVNNIKIILMGPLIPAIIGFVGLISTYLFISSNITLYLYSFFIMYSMHIINLMPFWGDGKNIVLALLKLKYKCH